jgi:hypothetical protein
MNLMKNISIETSLNQTSLQLTCMFRIDRGSVYKGYFNKDYLHWHFIKSLVYTGFLFIQGSI